MTNHNRLFQQQDLVSIQVDDGTAFWVQEAFLNSSSDYFRKALTGEFEESHTKTLHLPECGTETFKHLLFWMVNRDIEVPKWDENDSSQAQIQLAHLWAAGQMYLMPNLQNRVMECLWTVFEDSNTSVDAVCAAFDVTSEGSKLRKLFIMELVRDRIYDHEQSDEELDRLGALPGFFKAHTEMFAKRIELESRGPCSWEIDEFLVAEET